MSSKAKRPSPLDKFVTYKQLAALATAWEKKINEMDHETRRLTLRCDGLEDALRTLMGTDK